MKATNKLMKKLLAFVLVLGLMLGSVPGVALDTVDVEAAAGAYLTSIKLDGVEVPGFYPTITEYRGLYLDGKNVDNVQVTVEAPSGVSHAVDTNADSRAISVTATSGASVKRYYIYFDGPQSDEFNGTALNDDIWTVNGKDGKLKVSGGRVDLLSQNGSWWNDDENKIGDIKNMMMQPAGGDWENETLLGFKSLDELYNRVGLIISDGNDSDNYMSFRVERREATNPAGDFSGLTLRVAQEVNGKCSYKPNDKNLTNNYMKNHTFKKNNQDAYEIWLKVRKVGDQYTFYARPTDTEAWDEFYTTTVDYDTPTFGLYACNTETNNKARVYFYKTIFTALNKETGSANAFTVKSSGESEMNLAEYANYMNGTSVENDYLSHFEEGAYALYTVNVEKSGYYDVKTAFASASKKSDTFGWNLEVDGDLLSTWNRYGVTSDDNSNWQVFEEIDAEDVYLAEGSHKIKLATTPGTINMNLKYLKFNPIKLDGPVSTRPYVTSIKIHDKEVTGFYPTDYKYYGQIVEKAVTKNDVKVQTPEGTTATVSVENNTITVTAKNADGQESVYTITYSKAPQTDEFKGSSLDKGIWKVFNEDTSNYSVGNDKLTIKSQAGSWYNAETGAKNIIAQEAGGRWEGVTQVKIPGGLDAAYQGAGVMITDGEDEENYIWFRLEYTDRGNNDPSDDQVSLRLNQETNGKSVNIVNDRDYAKNRTIENVWYKVEKESNTYIFSISEDGNVYEQVGTVDATYAVPHFALAAFNGEGANVSTDAQFEYVRFDNKDITAAAKTFTIKSTGTNHMNLPEYAYYMNGLGKSGSGEDAYLSDITSGSYALFDVDVETAGYYDVTTNFAGTGSSTKYDFVMEIDGMASVNWEQNGTSTGEFKTLDPKNVLLSKGNHKLKIKFNTGNMKLKWAEFKLTKTLGETSELEKAYQALKTVVEAAGERIKEGQGDYTEASWDLFEAAFNEAAQMAYAELKELEEKGTTPATLDALRIALNNAVQGLKTNKDVEVEALNATIAKWQPTRDLELHDYTDATYGEFVKRFDEAVTAVKPEEVGKYTAEQLKAYNQALEAAGVSLRTNAYEAKKKELQDAIDAAKAKNYDKYLYTEESYDRFEKALNGAADQIETATETELESLLQELVDAEKGLVLQEVADAKAELEQLTKDIRDKGYKDVDFEETSWKKFVEALNKAEEVLANPDATVEEVKEAKKALEDAEAGLITKDEAAKQKELADAKAALQAALNAAKATYDAGQADYTDASWNAFKDAYEQALNLPANATIRDVQRAQEALDAAIKGLVKKPAAPALTEEEDKIKNQYGVSDEIAKLIAQAASKYNISLDTLLVNDTYLKSLKSDADVKGSTFGKLQARSVKQTKNSVKLKWTKVKDASGYLIYGNKCGKNNTYKLIKNVKSNKTTSYTQKKLKKGTYYKYIVIAYKNISGAKVTMAASKTIHTTTKGGNYGDAKSVKLKTKKTVSLKKGKTFTIKASEVKQDKKIKKHRKLAFESSNTKIATVTSKGKVKAKKKGKCTIYVYAQNGVYAKVSVNVK